MPTNESALVSRRSLLRGVGAAAGGVLLLGPTGCGPGGSGSGSNGYSGRYAVAHLESIVQGAPFLIAADQGYYDAEGLDLEGVSFDGGSATVQGIRSGMHFGMPATVAALIAYDKGARDLRIVGGLYNGGSVVFIAPTESPVNSADDLAGKKLAVSGPGSITNYFAHLVAGEKGLTPGKDVEILAVGGPTDCWTAATQGVADVAWAVSPLLEKLVESGEAKAVFATEDFVPSWCDNTLVVREPFLEDNTEAVQGWLAAVGKAIDLIKDDVDTAAQVWAKAADLDAAIAAEALRQNSDALTLRIDRDGIAQTIEAGKQLGQIQKNSNPPLDKIIVDDYLPAGFKQ